MQQLEFNSEEVLFKEQLETEDSRIGYCFLKRTMDVVCSSIGLIILSPIFLVVAILIRLESEGNSIFSQRGLEEMVKNLECISLDLWWPMQKS